MQPRAVAKSGVREDGVTVLECNINDKQAAVTTCYIFSNKREEQQTTSSQQGVSLYFEVKNPFPPKHCIRSVG